MKRPARIFTILVALWLALPVARAQSGTDAIGPGSKLDSLAVGGTTYQQVQVRSVTGRTLVITHAGGMASIRLRDLSPEWQARFHYNPAAEAPTEPAPVPATPPAPVRPTPKPATAAARNKFESMLQKFGQPAVVEAEVDYRQKIFQLELGVKNQGRRPSCAIFATVCALEFQNAELAGRAEKFSEEYLIWAVRKTVQRLPAAGGADDAAGKEDRDEGFSLTEVVAALRAYGIPLQASMPNTFGRKIEAIEDPPPAIIQEARSHQRVFVHLVPGRDAATRINNIVQALNAGVLVPVGMGWPNYRTLRDGYLSEQKPMPDGGHAVTIVGYKSATGRIEDAVFIFKNSYGVAWGQGGYGMVTYKYLNNNLHDAVLLEVQPG